MWLLYDDYGVTWDEGIQASYGELALEYFLSGGDDTRALEHVTLRRYGPAYEIPPAAIYRWLDVPKYPTRHLFTGLTALLALPGLAFLARRFPYRSAPALSVLGLLMLPRFIGHAFNNSKDIPFAIAIIWFTLAAARLLADRDFRWRWVLGCALAMALALWARPGAFPILAAWLVVARVSGLVLGPSEGTAVGRQASSGLAVWSVVVLAWLLMVLPWPWAHADPLLHPIEAMAATGSFPIEVPVLFNGRIYQSGALPWYYAPEFLAITTPPGLLVLALIGGALSIHRLAWGTRGTARATAAMLLAWLLLPLGIVVVLRPNLYDGIRHLLFVFPAIAVFAGLGGAWLVERPARPRWRVLAALAVLCTILAPLPRVIRLHPYEVTYFNAFVGGTRGAADRFETDYWVSSYGEAIRWINRQVGERGARVLVGGTEFVHEAAAYAAAPGVEVITTAAVERAGANALPADYDYYVGTTRYDLDSRYPDAPIVHTVGREGATFSVVKDLRPSSSGGSGVTSSPDLR